MTFQLQTTVEARYDNLLQVLRDFKDSGYETLMDLTAVDFLDPDKHTRVVYWLHNPSTLERIRVIIHVARDQSIPSASNIWEGADWYEREVYDLFGVRFEGHSDLQRILMPDDWKGHPLRRDYALTEEPVEFKHGVKPKVPSEIIPNVKKNAKNT